MKSATLRTAPPAARSAGISSSKPAFSSKIDVHIDLTEEFSAPKKSLLKRILTLGSRKALTKRVKIADKNSDGLFVASIIVPVGVAGVVKSSDGKSKMNVDSTSSAVFPFVSNTPWIEIQAWEVA